ncbi:hypothetical protein ACFLQ1_01750 [Candidatus Auribacterota bacterium]
MKKIFFLTILIISFAVDNIFSTEIYPKEQLIPENPLVLKWLEFIQDTASLEKQLLSSMEDNIAQTFNNSLAAICFILKNDKERAERILDFYSKATIVNNTDISLQNFFYKGEPRGFYQYTTLNLTEETAKYHTPWPNDRWIGDMAWLLIAYKYYEKIYDSNKYERITVLIKNLLISFYKKTDAGGYIAHGWQKNDSKLHEDFGHHEGNIDCYAALKLCGENYYADNIKKWLDQELIKKENLPLDLYSWRVLAFGDKYTYLLNIPEKDSRYKKTLTINSKKITGFTSGPMQINNLWIDGIAHMACAYLSIDNKQKGYFYANELDKLLIDRKIKNTKLKSLPYAINKLGGYDWVDTKKGFTSCACWYIFAKNEFNPFYPYK